MNNRETRDIEAAAGVIEEVPVSTDAKESASPSNEPASIRTHKPITLQDIVSPSKSQVAAEPAILELEVTLKLLHRCNILSIHYRLHRLLKEELDLTDGETSKRLGQELNTYCRFSTCTVS